MKMTTSTGAITLSYFNNTFPLKGKRKTNKRKKANLTENTHNKNNSSERCLIFSATAETEPKSTFSGNMKSAKAYTCDEFTRKDGHNKRKKTNYLFKLLFHIYVFRVARVII